MRAVPCEQSLHPALGGGIAHIAPVELAECLFGVGHTEGVNVMEEARNRNIRIGIVDNDPYALKVFGALIERMSSDFAVI